MTAAELIARADAITGAVGFMRDTAIALDKAELAEGAAAVRNTAIAIQRHADNLRAQAAALPASAPEVVAWRRKDPLRKFAEDFQRGKAGRADYGTLFDDGDLKGKAGPLPEDGWDGHAADSTPDLAAEVARLRNQVDHGIKLHEIALDRIALLHGLLVETLDGNLSPAASNPDFAPTGQRGSLVERIRAAIKEE